MININMYQNINKVDDYEIINNITSNNNQSKIQSSNSVPFQKPISNENQIQNAFQIHINDNNIQNKNANLQQKNTSYQVHNINISKMNQNPNNSINQFQIKQENINIKQSENQKRNNRNEIIYKNTESQDKDTGFTNEEIEKAKENGFILIGKTGVGKTSLLNVICGKNVGKVGYSTKSETKKSNFYCVKEKFD